MNKIARIIDTIGMYKHSIVFNPEDVFDEVIKEDITSIRKKLKENLQNSETVSIRPGGVFSLSLEGHIPELRGNDSGVSHLSKGATQLKLLYGNEINHCYTASIYVVKHLSDFDVIAWFYEDGWYHPNQWVSDGNSSPNQRPEWKIFNVIKDTFNMEIESKSIEALTEVLNKLENLRSEKILRGEAV